MLHSLPISDFSDDFTETGFKKLSDSLDRIERGNNQVLITPQAERVSPDEIFKAWELEFQANTDLLNDDLLELEMSNKAKFGPRSVAKPWSDIEDKLSVSFEPTDIDCSHLNDYPTKSSNTGSLRPITMSNSAKLMKRNTQAGAPTLEKKGKVIDYTLENFDVLYSKNLIMVPAIRTQEQGKTRIVMIYPAVDILQENRFFIPLFNLLKTEFCFSAFNGPEAVDKAITILIQYAIEYGQLCVSLDVENFDYSVKSSLQDSTFSEYKGYFQLQYHPEIEVIAERFKSKPLATPDGVWTGDHGIPSGSNNTGIIGSMAHRQVAQHPPELSQFLGDDGALVTDDPDKVFAKYESCGLTINRDKTWIKPFSFVYLQRLHHVDYKVDGEYKGIYPTWRALNRLIYPERFSDFNEYDITGKDYFAIRSLSILENCKYHPLFEKFVKFWMKYDKYSIPSNSSIQAYAKMTEEKIGSLGTQNQLGDSVRGLREIGRAHV